MSLVHELVVILCPAIHCTDVHYLKHPHGWCNPLQLVHTADVIETHDLCIGKVHAITHGYIVFEHYVRTIERGRI